MPQYSILPQSNQVTSNGINISVSMSTDPRFKNIHAIQIKNTSIDIEYLDDTPNSTNGNISHYQDIINQVENYQNPSILPISFDETKIALLSKLSKDIDTELSQGFTTNGFLLDAHLWDIQTLITVQTLATQQNSTSIDLVDFNNEVHFNIPLDIVSNIISELGTNYTTIFNKKQSIRSQIITAKNVNALNKISW